VSSEVHQQEGRIGAAYRIIGLSYFAPPAGCALHDALEGDGPQAPWTSANSNIWLRNGSDLLVIPELAATSPNKSDNPVTIVLLTANLDGP